MPRATNNPASRRRRKKILKAAKGYYGRKSKTLKNAKEAVERSMLYAYRDRRNRKRVFRRLWITRINAAARLHGLSYS
ncbi:MAG TPA: 50S ribosomal protein L20, partial [Bacteroidetes bacterium]|nr:50S ribosomal protein L20 [Bacteroidota bacterium]